MKPVTIVVPCHNEESLVASLIRNVLSQSFVTRRLEDIQLIIAANGCSDRTVEIASSYIPTASRAGLRLSVLDLARPGKAWALSRASDRSRERIWIFWDADVTCEPEMVEQLADVLSVPEPLWASGRLTITPPRSRITRSYAAIWSQMPFVRNGFAGCGLYAMNAAGRRRFDDFPDVHSDDKFARLMFLPHERKSVSARYFWPLPEGFVNLVKVRRRWCEGNAELLRRFPVLRHRDDNRNMSARAYGRILLRNPPDTMIFCAIFAISALLARAREADAPAIWRRGR